MIAESDYAQKLIKLQGVNFAGPTPWLQWKEKDLNAIADMFGYVFLDDQGNEHGEILVDRQSNVAGGRLLFVFSQSSKNPYRAKLLFSRNRRAGGL
jgi:hypothetical protein